MGVYTDKARELRPLVETAVQSLGDAESIIATSLFPLWDANINYETGTKVRYEGVLYKVLQDHTSQPDWTPNNAPSLYATVLTSEDGTPLEWVQPDSTNPYMTGDRVIYNGVVYESTIDNNIWAPDAYPDGWSVVE